MHRHDPEQDPLAILNEMDNADKHRLLHTAFVYPGGERGVDLIEVVARGRVRATTNHWESGQKLEHGTRLAMYLIRPPFGDIPLRSNPGVVIGSACVG